MASNSEYRIVVMSGMSGFFAVLMDPVEGPVETGFGRYATAAEARREGVLWSVNEGWDLGFDLTPDEVALRQANLPPVEAYEADAASMDFPEDWEV